MAQRVNPGGGCLTLFGLCFVGAGFTGLFVGGNALANREHNAWVPVVVGFVFTFVGAGIVILARFSARAARHQAELTSSQPEELWAYRADWRAGEIISSDKTNVWVVWFFAVFWNAISMPVAFRLPDMIKGSGDNILYVFFLFPVVGVFLIYQAIRTTLRFRKYGSSRLKMLSVPGEIGGSLSGFIETGMKIPSDDFRLTLRCVQRITTGSGKNRHTEERVLWEVQKDVHGLSTDTARQSGIPVLFSIPASCSATSLAQNISWQLAAKAETPGLDFETSFEVPVFEVAAEKRRPANDSEFAARYEVPTDPAKVMAASGVRIHRVGAGTEFTFAAARNKGAAVMMTLVAAVCLAAYQLPVKPKNHNLFLIVWALLSAFFLFQCLSMWTAWSRVRVDANGLLVTRRWLFLPRRKAVAHGQLACVQTRFSWSAGHTKYYDVQAVTVAGEKFTLATSVRGQRECDLIAEEIQRALGKS